MSDYVKHTIIVFTIIYIIAVIIIGLIARKTYLKTNNDRLVKIFYIMLIISIIIIEVILRMSHFTYKWLPLI